MRVYPTYLDPFMNVPPRRASGPEGVSPPGGNFNPLPLDFTKSFKHIQDTGRGGYGSITRRTPAETRKTTQYYGNHAALGPLTKYLGGLMCNHEGGHEKSLVGKKADGDYNSKGSEE